MKQRYQNAVRARKRSPMHKTGVPSMTQFGGKLRAARRKQRFSLRELAARAEVSASLLSKIENGKANPSIRTLQNITEALSMSVSDLFSEEKTADTPQKDNLARVSKSDTAPEAAASKPTSAKVASAIDSITGAYDVNYGKLPHPILVADQRPTIELSGGVTWSRLTPESEEGVEFLQTCYEVGANSEELSSHHSGREFHVVLEGEMVLELGQERYLLKPGDSVIFDSKTPHRLGNAGQVPLRAISVIFNKE